MSYSPLTFKQTPGGYLVSSDFFSPLYRLARQRDGRLLCGCPDAEYGEEGHVCKHELAVKVIAFMSEWWAGRYQQQVDRRLAAKAAQSAAKWAAWDAEAARVLGTEVLAA